MNTKLSFSEKASTQVKIRLNDLEDATFFQAPINYGSITKAILPAFCNDEQCNFCIISPSHTVKAEILPLSGIPTLFNYLLCR